MGLRVRDLTVARGGVPVLEGLNFDLAPGEALIVRGTNGAGKTTLLRSLTGLQPPLSGTIEGAEESIAYAGHSDGIKTALSVQENLSFWARVFGQSDTLPALEAFHLLDLASRRAGELSAGQKRRVSLARLLVTGRAIWVLDEPTVSLDAAAVSMFAAAIKTHLATGGSAIIATHIDLGFEARELDVERYRYKMPQSDPVSEAYL